MGRPQLAVMLAFVVLLGTVAPVAAQGHTADRTVDETPDDLAESSRTQTAHLDSHGHDGNGTRAASTATDSEQRDRPPQNRSHTHRDAQTRPHLFDFDAESGAFTVGEGTTVTARVTARESLADVAVTVPDYPFVDVDRHEIAIGDMTAGETRTVNLTVTPTVQRNRDLQFGLTAGDGGVRRAFYHAVETFEAGTETAPLVYEPGTTTSATDAAETTEARTAATTAGTVTGEFVYTLPNGSVRPGRNLLVKLYDDDPVGRDYMQTTRTNDDGEFTFTVSDPTGEDVGRNNPADVVAVVYAENDAVFVSDGMFRRTYGVRSTTSSQNLGDGGTVDFGRFGPSSSDAAFQAADWALDEYRFIQRETGWTRSQVRIQYEQGDWPVYHYLWRVNGEIRRNWERISLPDRGTAGWDRSTIYHEYAHAVHMAMFGMDVDNRPSKGDYETHYILSETDPGFALVEGFAEFMEGAVFENRSALFNSTGRQWTIESNNWYDITTDPNDGPGSDRGDTDGFRTEGSIASILFDIVDGGPNDDDGLEGSFATVFRLMLRNDVQNVGTDLWDHWDAGDRAALRRIYADHGIAKPDQYENNDSPATATPVNTGQTIDAQISTYTESNIQVPDVDYYAVTLNGGDWLNVTTDYATADGDLNITLFAPDGTEVANVTTPTGEESITHVAGTGGRYVLRVRSRPGDLVPYRIYTEIDDRFEQNDERVEATDLDGDSHGLALRLQDGDVDMFETSLMRHEQVNVTLEFDDQRSDLSVTLENATGNVVARGNRATNAETLSYRAPEAGGYYVNVSGAEDEWAPYRLSVETADIPDREYEPNDRHHDAARATAGFLDDLQITADDVDVYETDLRLGEELNVSLQHDFYSGALDLYVYTHLDGEPVHVASHTANANVKNISYTATDSGTHYVLVNATREMVHGYNLTLETAHGPRTTGPINNDRHHATEVVPETYTGLELSPSDTEDFYEIYLEEGQGLAVSAGHPYLTEDVYVEILDGARREVWQYSGGNATVDFVDDWGGRYYIRVFTRNPTHRTPYTLDVQRVTDDRFEDNDRNATAAHVEPGVYEDLWMVAEPDFDGLPVENDTYTFDAMAGDPLNVTVAYERWNAEQLRLYVYAPDGTRVGQDVTYADEYSDNQRFDYDVGAFVSDAVEQVTATAPQNGTYTVRVEPYVANQVYQYDLGIRGPTPPLAGVQPDSLTEALDAYPGNAEQVGSGTHGGQSLAAGESDEFAVSLTAGESLRASTDTSGVALALYDGDGAELASGQSSLRHTVSENGTYYLQTENGGVGDARYALSVSTPSTANDRLEHNDDFESAAPVHPGRFGGLRTMPSDPDVFAIDLTRNQRLTATVDPTESGLTPPDLTIYGPGQSEQASGGTPSGGTRTSTTAAGQAGTYYVEVAGATADTPYALDIGVETPANDRFEDNDERGSAAELTPGRYEGLRIATGDRDVFAVALSAGERVQVDMGVDQSDGDLNTWLVAPDGRIVAGGLTDTNDESFQTVATETGTYYLVVAGESGSAADYDLELRTTDPPANDRFEDNDDPNTATQVGLGHYPDLQLLLGERDVFTVDVGANERLTVIANFSDERGDIDLSVYNPDGVPQAVSQSMTDDERVSFVAERAGSHTIVVDGWDNATVGYDLTLSNESSVDVSDLETAVPDPPNVSAPAPSDLPTLSVDTTYAGQFAISDANYDGFGPQDRTTFEGTNGETVTVSLTGSRDVVVALEGPDGERLHFDDDGGAGTNARLADVTLPASGTYTVVAASRWPDIAPRYNLTLERETAETARFDLVAEATATAEPGGTVTIDYDLRYTGDSSEALIVDAGTDTLPPGWQVESRSDGGGLWRDGTAVWLFRGVDGTGVTPSATLTVPENATPGATVEVPARAFTRSNASERATVTLPIREQNATAAVDADEDGIVDDMEVLDAIERWQNGEPVAGAGRTLTDTEILQLIEAWQSDDE